MICYPLLGHNGRFGNQLFQIAATYSHAIDCNTEALFPSWEHNVILKNKINTYTATPSIENEYTEKHFYYDPIPNLPNLAIKGYFQSERYFLKNKQKILEQFTFTDELIEKIQLKYKDFLNQSPVGVQLRTYTHGPIDPRHIHCDVFENPDFIKKAFNYYGKDRLFLIFTDNFKYTSQRFPVRNNIKILNTNDFYEDFILLTLCTDYIISASSFGWWGSYLSKNNDKKIIMPELWFKISDDWHDTRDIYPQGIIKI